MSDFFLKEVTEEANIIRLLLLQTEHQRQTYGQIASEICVRVDKAEVTPGIIYIGLTNFVLYLPLQWGRNELR